ncbi:protein-histidine N-methyltransferase [Malassezia sp. CBS 17886]|nr:protein-histidine N-methyltransferase [Malassezia sp. CBS 17886]
MSFSFAFDVGCDADDAAVPGSADAAVPPEAPATPSSCAARASAHPSRPVDQSTLRQLLPDKISFSSLAVPLGDGRALYVARRDLFDVRFQILNEDTESSPAPLDVDSDLIPGVYEGGLKTWECALDLVAVLDEHVRRMRAGGDATWPQGRHIVEVGCGTAVPSCYLLRALFDMPAPPSAPTVLNLADYNEEVLSLVVYPNLLLSWYFAAAGPGANADAGSGDLELDGALLDAFETALAQRMITLRFFAGSWDALQLSPRCADLVLTSETVYAVDSAQQLCRVLEAMCWPTDEDNTRAGVQPSSTLCLIAAKVLYFGVGGGVDEFRATLAQHGGWSAVVRHIAKGVGRVVIRAGWQARGGGRQEGGDSM